MLKRRNEVNSWFEKIKSKIFEKWKTMGSKLIFFILRLEL